MFVVLLLFSLSASVFSWYNLDKLPPVSYVEDIVILTKNISPILFIASIFSLFLLISPFFINRSIENKLQISFGVYYALLIISSFFGNFPIMIMGYGISPIIGYFIGLIWLIEKNKTAIIDK